MINDVARVSRGQVFYYHPAWAVLGKGANLSELSTRGSLESKIRPYLVVSTNKGNFSSSTCNLLPITTRDEVAISSQVKFFYKNRPQVILTEQIVTANIDDLGDYIYTVNDNIMELVEAGILIQFAISCKAPSIVLEDLVCKLNDIIDKAIDDSKKKFNLVNAVQLGDLVQKLCDSVKNLLLVPEESCNSEVLTKQEVDVPNCVNDAAKVKSRVSKKRSKRSMSEEEILDFLKDCDRLSMEELKVKYALLSNHMVSDRKYRLKKKLSEMEALKFENPSIKNSRSKV